MKARPRPVAAAVLTISGTILLGTGATMLYGPVALVGLGLVLLIIGVLMGWEGRE